MDYITSDTPRLVIYLIWSVTVVTGVGFLWRKLTKFGNMIMDFLRKELNTNGGGSTKDRAIKAARLAGRALKLVTIVEKRQIEIGGKVDVLSEEVKQVIGEFRHAAAEIKAFREQFSRYVIHAARNDMNHSALLEEEKRMMREQGAIVSEGTQTRE